MTDNTQAAPNQPVEVQLQARSTAGGDDWCDIYPAQLEFIAKYCNVRAIERSPPSPQETRRATIEECALVAEGFDAACNSPRMKLFKEAGLVLAVYKRDGEIGAAIRALSTSPAPAEEVRAAVIEECAKVAARNMHSSIIPGHVGTTIAAEIRSLTSPDPKQTTKDPQ